MNDQPTPSQDDKIVSALAHAAAILPMWGLLVSILIWVTQREKSEYIRQQALQALAWQAVQICLFLGGMVLYMGSFFIMFGTTMFWDDSAMGMPPGFFLPFCVMGFIVISFVITIIVALYAAVRNLQGRPFTYPIIGARVQAYLAK